MVERPGEVEWFGEGTYRVLSYVFRAAWNWEDAGAYVEFVLGRFAEPPPEPADPPTPGWLPGYLLTSTGDAFRLLWREQVLVESVDPRDVLNHFSWHVNAAAMQSTGDFLLVHAGSVATPSGIGILLPGRSGSGKTSLVVSLVREGFGYLSDEAGAIDPVTRRVYPFPKVLSLKVGVYERFADLLKPQRWPTSSREQLISPEQIRPGAIAGPCEIGSIIVLRRRETGRPAIARLDTADALMTLLDNTINRWIYEARAIELLADIVPKASCFLLETSNLDDAVRGVLDITSSTPPA